MNRAIQLDPWESFGYSSRGFIWAGKHENEKALADFNEAVRRDPTSGTRSRPEASSSARSIDSMRPWRTPTAAIRLAPKYPDGYLLRSGVSNQRHEFDKAIADATMGIKLDTRDANAFVLRGDANYRKDDLDKALWDYAEAIRLGVGPREPELLIRRAEIFEWRRHPQGDGRLRHSGTARSPGTPPCSPARAPPTPGRGITRRPSRTWRRPSGSTRRARMPACNGPAATTPRASSTRPGRRRTKRSGSPRGTPTPTSGGPPAIAAPG